MKQQRLIRQKLDEGIQELLGSIEFRRMTDNEDREAVLRMRHNGYRKSFPVEENWQGFTDQFDAHDNTMSFGIFIAGQLASTILLSVITHAVRDAQAVAMYGKHLHPLLDQGDVMLDVTRLVVDPRLAQEIPELPYLTFRIVAMACEHYQVDETISALRIKHVPFYKRIFGGRVIGESVYSPPLRSDFNLVVFPLNAITEDLSQKFTSWQSTYLERRQLFGRCDAIAGIGEKKCKLAA